MRRLALGLIALLCALVALLAFGPDGFGPGSAGAPAQGSDTASTPRAPLALDADPEPEPEPESVARRATVAPEPGPDPAAAGEASIDAPPRLLGRLVLLDEGGAELPPPSGTLTLTPYGAPQTQSVGMTFRRSVDSVAVEVLDGGFELEVLDGYETAQVDRFRSSTAVALPTQDAVPQVLLRERSEPLVIRVQRVGACTVHVLSRTTGADLDGVEVRVIEQPGSKTSSDPDAHATAGLFASTSSPFTVDLAEHLPRPIFRQELQLLLRAHGHAWQFLSVPLRGRDRAVVELTPVGSLELILEGPVEQVRPGLTLHAGPMQARVLELDRITERRLVLEDLPVGDLQATLRAGSTRHRGPVLARAALEVRGDVQNVATIPFEALEALPRVTVAGRIRVAAAWSPLEPQLLLNRFGIPEDGGDASQMTEASFPSDPTRGFFAGRFEFSDVYPGPHGLTLPAVGWRLPLEVPEAGLEELELEVPPPTELELVFVDEATGAAVEVRHVSAATGPPERYPGLQFGRRFEEDGGVWRGTCAPGVVEVSYGGPGVPYASTTIEVAPGLARHTIEVGQSPELVLSFELDGRPVAPPTDLHVDLHGPDGPVLILSRSFGGMQTRISLPPDTSVEVRLPRPNGYRELAPFTVDTAETPVHERTLQLVPLR